MNALVWGWNQYTLWFIIIDRILFLYEDSLEEKDLIQDSYGVNQWWVSIFQQAIWYYKLWSLIAIIVKNYAAWTF